MVLGFPYGLHWTWHQTIPSLLHQLASCQLHCATQHSCWRVADHHVCRGMQWICQVACLDCCWKSEFVCKEDLWAQIQHGHWRETSHLVPSQNNGEKGCLEVKMHWWYHVAVLCITNEGIRQLLFKVCKYTCQFGVKVMVEFTTRSVPSGVDIFALNTSVRVNTLVGWVWLGWAVGVIVLLGRIQTARGDERGLEDQKVQVELVDMLCQPRLVAKPSLIVRELAGQTDGYIGAMTWACSGCGHGCGNSCQCTRLDHEWCWQMWWEREEERLDELTKTLLQVHNWNGQWRVKSPWSLDRNPAPQSELQSRDDGKWNGSGIL